MISPGADNLPVSNSIRRRTHSTAVQTHKRHDSARHERASSESASIKIKAQLPHAAGTVKSKSKRDSSHQQSFLDLDESPGPDSAESDGHDIESEPESIAPQSASDETGYTLNKLVDRLLSQPLSKGDSKFSAMFLALYRNFATPGQLLDAILKRFNVLEKDRDPQMIRTVSQLRYLAILEQWISSYPGDFAFPATKAKMKRFIIKIASNRIFAIAAQELVIGLELVAEDDDTDWACCDKARQGADPKSNAREAAVYSESSEEEEYAELLSGINVNKVRASNKADSVLSGSITQSVSSKASRTLMSTVENAQKQASRLVPVPRLPFSKAQWHLLMGIDEDIIARELTRIDWIMFSSIRPRDFLRNVTLDAEQKKKCKSLENVSRMTDHFNHLATWVMNYILLRDKPKHRAMMLEKVMKIARVCSKRNSLFINKFSFSAAVQSIGALFLFRHTDNCNNRKCENSTTTTP